MTEPRAADRDLLSRSQRLRRRRLMQIPVDGQVFADEQGRGWGGPQVTTAPAELRDLITSIGTSGVLQPILVEELEDGALRIVSGHRRVAACRWGLVQLRDTPQHRNYETIPAVVVPGPLTEEERRSFQLIENLGRVALMPGELAAALLYERSAVLNEALTAAGHTPDAEIMDIADPVARWQQLDAFRRSHELWTVGAPWSQVLQGLGIELPEKRCKQLAAALRQIPSEISVEMDTAQVALTTRQHWIRLRKGRQQAAEEIWSAVQDRNPALLARAVKEAEADPDATPDQVVDAAEAFHVAANESRAATQRRDGALPPAGAGPPASGPDSTGEGRPADQDLPDGAGPTARLDAELRAVLDDIDQGRVPTDEVAQLRPLLARLLAHLDDAAT